MEDSEIIAQWLHGRGEHTTRAYRKDMERFRSFVRKPLKDITLADLQRFDGSLRLAPASRARILAAVKSLFAFATEQDYLAKNPASALKLPRTEAVLAERILPEEKVLRMLALETDPQNHALLRLLYASGIRVSELLALRWKAIQSYEKSGQISVVGKGKKVRSVTLPPSVFEEVMGLRGDAGDEAPVFGKDGKPLSSFQVWKIVRTAARRAGIAANVSAHWLRHAHASHALERGAPVRLVQETLGHASLATTGRYLHARPGKSSGDYLPL